MPKGKNSPNQNPLAIFFKSPTWWVTLLAMFIWFTIPGYSGVKSVTDLLFGGGVPGEIVYIIAGLIVGAVLWGIGSEINDHDD